MSGRARASAKRALTCDEQDGIARAAVWRGKHLQDLIVERIDRPSLTGALVGGKITRIASAQKLAFADCGLDAMVAFTATPDLHCGDTVRLILKAPARKDKAFDAVRAPDAAAPEVKQGLIAPPPSVWERALQDFGVASFSSLSFAQRADHVAAFTFLETRYPDRATILQPLCKTSPHPDLAETLDALQNPVVPLSPNAALIIESTEALVAIDVNHSGTAHPLSVNLLAVAEVARQIRLRNLSGTIMIDCLKMQARTDTNKLLQAFKEATEQDPAGVTVCGLTKLGLLECARTRRGAPLSAVLGSSHAQGA